jgi:exodeoxyribonuclease V gamma subunit
LKQSIIKFTMGFKLYASRYIDRLADRVVSDLKEHYKNSTDAFTPVHIVTQTEGMNVWLSARVAEKTGISANLRFLTPQTLLEVIHEKLSGSVKQKFTQESVVWVLYMLLGEEDFTANQNPDFQRVAHYLGGDTMKRLGLAGKLADLFDQYPIYRHTMIEEWNREGAGVDDFQKYLWHRLKETLGDMFQDKTILRSSLLGMIPKGEKEKEEFRKGPFGKIYFFGLSVFTPYHLDIMERLSEVSDIGFYMLNPAASDYWYEDLPENVVEKWKVLKPDRNPVAGNNLLVNWGKIIQQTFGMILERDGLSNSYDSLDDEDYTKYHTGGGEKPITSLGLLQQQIMFNVTGRDKIFDETHVKDDSIQVHACYTPAREVEALYNHLVALFEKDNEIRGRDVVVSCDIDAYAPYIRAVFETGPVKFNYTISDATYAQGDSPLKALVAIMELGDSEFNAEEVIRLLDYTCIREKFNLKDVSLLREVVRKSMFRFGVEGREDDDSRLFGLNKGIERIVHGIAMRIEGAYKDFFPLDMIEGHDSDQAIRFCQFAEALAAAVSQRKEDRTLEDWTGYAESLMETFLFDPDSEDDNELFMQELVNRELGRLNSVSSTVNEKVPYRLFALFLSEALSKERRMRRFHSNGITFCSQVPMRSLPFKVVCMMGLDHDKFPRQDATMAFSKIDGSFPGDRSVRSNDKHLFLESVMSAGSHLFLSYIGSGVKDNSVIPPSVLVDELLNYILDRSEDPDAMRKALVIRHPLHSFSNRYNAEGSGLVSYLIGEKGKEMPLMDASIEMATRSTVSLSDLCRFYQNPIRHHYQKVLKVYFEDFDENIPVTEKFDLEKGLDSFILANWIIKEGIDMSNYRSKVLAGEFPPSKMGEALMEIQMEKHWSLKLLFEKLRNGKVQDTRNVSVKWEDGIELTGSIDCAYGDILLDYTVSSSPNNRKHIISFCIKYLALNAMDTPFDGHIITKVSKNDFTAWKLKNMDRETSSRILRQFVEIYSMHSDSMMPFYPDLNTPLKRVFESITKQDEMSLTDFEEYVSDSVAQLANKVDEHFENTKYDEYAKDAYRQGVFSDPEFLNALFAMSRKVYSPLITSVIDQEAFS